jgi:hypothetical protein
MNEIVLTAPIKNGASAPFFIVSNRHLNRNTSLPKPLPRASFQTARFQLEVQLSSLSSPLRLGMKRLSVANAHRSTREVLPRLPGDVRSSDVPVALR